MSENFFPNRVESLMAGYALQVLSPEELAELELNIVAYPGVVKHLRQYQEVAGLLVHALPLVAAPARLRSQILAAIDAQNSRAIPGWTSQLVLDITPEDITPEMKSDITPDLTVDSSPVAASGELSTLTQAQVMTQVMALQRGVWLWRAIAAVALVSLGLGLGIDNYLLRRQMAARDHAIASLQQAESHQLQNVNLMEATITALQGSDTHVFTLRGTKAAAGASGSVILDLKSGVALLALQDLPMLPAGESYHLWAFTQDEKIFCGTFNTPPSGKIVDKIAIAKDAYNSPVISMRISKESTANPPDLSKKTLVMTSEI